MSLVFAARLHSNQHAKLQNLHLAMIFDILHVGPLAIIVTCIVYMYIQQRVNIKGADQTIRIYYEYEGGIENPTRGSPIGIMRLAE